MFPYRFGIKLSPLILGSLIAFPTTITQAQILPDATLDLEASTLVTDQVVRGNDADVVEGGATRGGNLFHSFHEFNVTNGQRVYFANPIGIDSILSRVTGDNTSQILGTLGVDGAANLFLINPKGIVFGEDVQLDIAGSFYATTAEAIELGDVGVFSAISPEQSQLLSINPSVAFGNYLTDNSGDILNRGQLTIGGNLGLVGQNLDLQGQVITTGNMSLLAANTVQIRDTTETPFIALAGGNLLIQGNQHVDIVALSHPDSELYAYGDITLRSSQPVGGDAHYFSGEDFRIEQLDGTIGDLFSPIDPIIRALGDVEFDGYLGSSLHILAGGSIKIGTVLITRPDSGTLGVDFLQETIQLSDGTTVVIDGGAQPTFDARAGVSRPEVIGALPTDNPSGQGNRDIFLDDTFRFVPPSLTNLPSTADVVVANIQLNAPNGLVVLTNQYAPNTTLPNGNIVVMGEGILGNNGINAQNSNGQGGTVYLDSRNDISVINSAIDTSSLEAVGDIIIVADGTVTFDGADGSRLTGALSDLVAGGMGSGGNVRITARNLEVLNGARLTSQVRGRGQGGDVVLTIRETARFEGSNPSNSRVASGIFNSIAVGGEGQGGNIFLNARHLEVLNGAQLSTSTFGLGDAGDVTLRIDETASFDGVDSVDGSASGAFSLITSNGQGRGGTVHINARHLDVLNGAQLSTSTFNMGDAGDVILVIAETARFDGIDLATDNVSGASSNVGRNGQGQGGNVQINARHLEVLNGAELSASTFGIGDAGDVILVIDGTARFDGGDRTDGITGGAFSSIEFNGEGQGGDIRINAQSLEVLGGANLSSSTDGVGNAGDVILIVAETARFNGSAPTIEGSITTSSSSATSRVQPNGQGQAGDVRINARNLDVLNGAQLVSGTEGLGNAGNVILVIDETARFDGSDPIDGTVSAAFSSIESTGEGQGGNVEINARDLAVLNGAQLVAVTEGNGDAGDVILVIAETARFDGRSLADPRIMSGAFSNVEHSGDGQGGDVRLQATNVDLSRGAQLFAGSLGQGDAGDVVLTVHNRLTATDGTIGTNASVAAGGQIQIDADMIVLSGDSDIQTFVNSGADDGGNITIVADAVVAFDDSDILAFAADGRGGNIDLSRTAFFGQNFEFAPPGTDPRTLENNNRVDINASGGLAPGTILLTDISFLEDSLTELPDNLVNPETLVASSCITRRNDISSGLVITGSGGLAQQPDNPQAIYTLGDIRKITQGEDLEPDLDSHLIEPQEIYLLADGRLVMGQKCN